MVSALQTQLLSAASNGSKPGITAIVENITPTIAKIYLETQKINRKLNKSRVKQYAIKCFEANGCCLAKELLLMAKDA